MLIKSSAFVAHRFVYYQIFFLGSIYLSLFYLAKFLWSSKVLSKVKAFDCLVTHRKVNIN